MIQKNDEAWKVWIYSKLVRLYLNIINPDTAIVEIKIVNPTNKSSFAFRLNVGNSLNSENKAISM